MVAGTAPWPRTTSSTARAVSRFCGKGMPWLMMVLSSATTAVPSLNALCTSALSTMPCAARAAALDIMAWVGERSDQKPLHKLKRGRCCPNHQYEKVHGNTVLAILVPPGILLAIYYLRCIEKAVVAFMQPAQGAETMENKRWAVPGQWRSQKWRRHWRELQWGGLKGLQCASAMSDLPPLLHPWPVGAHQPMSS